MISKSSEDYSGEAKTHLMRVCMSVRAELRDEMSLVVGNLDARWLSAASEQICVHLTHLMDTLLQGQRPNILAWIPQYAGEADVTSFITHQLTHRHVYLPRFGTGELQFLRVSLGWQEELVESHFGLREYQSHEPRLFENVLAPTSVVLVPGLAFDRKGNRLNRRKAFYDDFLQRQGMGSLLKIGVCWKFQILSEVPVSPGDTSMDWICHERGCFSTNS